MGLKIMPLRIIPMEMCSFLHTFIILLPTSWVGARKKIKNINE